MKHIINITVIESKDIRDISIKSEATPAAIMAGAARLLALTEIELPEALRADFRAYFLEELEHARTEVYLNCENR